MKYASEDLSRELYEVSNWDGLYGDGLTDDTRNLQRKADGLFPLYTLGYLIRKLPAQSGIAKLSSSYMAVCDPTLSDLLKPELQNQYTADSPEDAVCRMVINLFHQNILQRAAQ